MPPIFHKKSRWAWVLCALLLGGFLTNSFSDYLVARENVRKTIAESTLPLTSDNVYSEIQRDLLRPIFIASLMANDTFLRDWAIAGEEDESAVVRYLNELKIEYGTVTSFFVSEESRKYTTRTACSKPCARTRRATNGISASATWRPPTRSTSIPTWPTATR